MHGKKQVKDYIIWGIVATFVNVGLFKLLLVVGIDYKVANLSAIIFNRFFSYIANKLFVFRTKCKDIVELLQEMLSFFVARLVTLLIDYFGVYFLVEFFDIGAMKSKISVAVVVIVANYLLSKFFVFSKGRRNV